MSMLELLDQIGTFTLSFEASSWRREIQRPLSLRNDCMLCKWLVVARAVGRYAWKHLVKTAVEKKATEPPISSFGDFFSTWMCSIFRERHDIPKMPRVFLWNPLDSAHCGALLSTGNTTRFLAARSGAFGTSLAGHDLQHHQDRQLFLSDLTWWICFAFGVLHKGSDYWGCAPVLTAFPSLLFEFDQNCGTCTCPTHFHCWNVEPRC